MAIKNDRVLKALAREPLDRTPIWIMRQAGRYLPEYRATRARAGSFLQLCKTPELACEVTLQPLARYALDAAIVFSDILTIPDAMGLGLNVIENKGPVFSHPVQNAAQINRLTVPDAEQLNYVYEVIQLIQHDLADKIPLIGFCGSPWTLAAYMIQGQSQPGFPLALKMLNSDPSLLHKLLDILAQSVCAHLNAQIAAGVKVVMIFDTWGGLLSTPNYAEFSLAYLKQIMIGLNRTYNNSKIPVILFTKGGHQWLEDIAQTGCDGVSIDWEISLHAARARIGHQVALQGNLNPDYLLTTPEKIQREVAKVLESFGSGSGHVFNLGHGITPAVPVEHVTALIEAVHELSKPYHL